MNISLKFEIIYIQVCSPNLSLPVMTIWPADCAELWQSMAVAATRNADKLLFTQLSKIRGDCWSQISWALIRSPFHPSDLSLISNGYQPQPLDWLTHEPRISTGLHERFSSAMWEFCKVKIRLIWTLCFWCGPQHTATCRLMSMSKNCISN